MADYNDEQKLTSFLETLNQIETTIKEPVVNTEESCIIQLPVNSFEREKRQNRIQTCLMENENCHSLLNIIECSINMLLEKCIGEQQIVEASIEEHMKRQGTSFNTQEYWFARVLTSAPYFKDDKGFSPPPNKDVSFRNVQGFLNPYRGIIYNEWNKFHERAVLKFIRKVEEEKWTETLKSCGMLHMANVEKMTLKELIESRRDEYDWFQISVSCLRNAHSPEECKRLWFLCFHPEINQEAWSEEENKKLKTLVIQHKGQDWDNIVRELGTKRSTFSSFVHYQLHLSEMKTRQWNVKEIDALKYYVKLFICKGYVDWDKLSSFIDGRCLYDVRIKWHNMKYKGYFSRIFSLEEDLIVVAGMRTFGQNYGRIAEYLPDRNSRQVWNRIRTLTFRQFPSHVWTAEEDDLLVKLVKKYGYGNWKKIRTYFVNRRFVKDRYDIILKSQLHRTLRVTAPRFKHDIVTIKLLWEAVIKICQDNNIPVDNLDNSSVNIVHELSEILKPKMRRHKAVAERKLRPISNNEYAKFFLGAYTLNESNQKITRKMRSIVHAFVHDVVVVLKLLEAKLSLPVSKQIKKDTAISSHDKFIIKFLMKEIESRNDACSDIFLLTNSKCESMVADENAGIKSDNSHYLFPPNFSSLLAMRSLLLNSKNQEEQREGLTMQVDNIELKELYGDNSLRKINYSENHTIASKIWVKRLHLLLSGVAVLLKEKENNCPLAFFGRKSV